MQLSYMYATFFYLIVSLQWNLYSYNKTLTKKFGRYNEVAIVQGFIIQWFVYISLIGTRAGGH